LNNPRRVVSIGEELYSQRTSDEDARAS